ncbi:MAG: hypothetical protein ACRDAX_10130 [Propionibacteriaceae bacterium]
MVGDRVFIENKTRQGLEPRFGKEKCEIIEKRGGTITVRSEDGTTYKRSTNQAKKINDFDKARKEVEEKKKTNTKTTLTAAERSCDNRDRMEGSSKHTEMA